MMKVSIEKSMVNRKGNGARVMVFTSGVGGRQAYTERRRRVDQDGIHLFPSSLPSDATRHSQLGPPIHYTGRVPLGDGG